jgi:hypothetical protein
VGKGKRRGRRSRGKGTVGGDRGDGTDLEHGAGGGVLGILDGVLQVLDGVELPGNRRGGR